MVEWLNTQMQSTLHYGQQGVQLLSDEHDFTARAPPPPAPLPAPLPTPKYNRLKHSLTDCMTACQSCVLGETSEAEQLSGDEASAPAADEEEWII